MEQSFSALNLMPSSNNDRGKHLYRTYCMSGTVSSTYYILIHLILQCPAEEDPPVNTIFSLNEEMEIQQVSD